MILVDTSVWIDHLRSADGRLSQVLEQQRVLVHPMVIGEIALGSLQDRADVLEGLSQLPSVLVADHDEVLSFVDRHGLQGSGLQLVDAHLLASVLISPGASLWTRDRRLEATAQRLGIAA